MFEDTEAKIFLRNDKITNKTCNGLEGKCISRKCIHILATAYKSYRRAQTEKYTPISKEKLLLGKEIMAQSLSLPHLRLKGEKKKIRGKEICENVHL